MFTGKAKIKVVRMQSLLISERIQGVIADTSLAELEASRPFSLSQAERCLESHSRVNMVEKYFL